MEVYIVKKTYGYVRVSSRDQNEERQLIAMRHYPFAYRNIWRWFHVNLYSFPL